MPISNEQNDQLAKAKIVSALIANSGCVDGTAKTLGIARHLLTRAMMHMGINADKIAKRLPGKPPLRAKPLTLQERINQCQNELSKSDMQAT